MEKIVPGRQTVERAEIPQTNTPPAQATAPVQEAQVKEGQAGKKESPGRAYLKAIAIMMTVFLGIPALGFLFLFPYFLSFMMYTPQLIPLLLLAFIAYYAVASYWFFKKGMFRRMLNTSTRFGMQWSNKMMANIDPGLKKEMMEKAMKDESMKQFKEQIKEEIREEMKREAQGTEKQRETENTNY